MNLAAAFAASAEKHQNKTALCWGEQVYTYDRVIQQTRHLGRHLQQTLGVKPGDRVALWLKNCPEFVPALFGTLLAGGVVVPINNFLKPAEVSYILNDAEADVLITDAAMSEGLPELAATRPRLKCWKVEDFQAIASAAGGATPALVCDRVESDLAVLIYTSGTTGRPKGAMLSHGNLL